MCDGPDRLLISGIVTFVAFIISCFVFGIESTYLTVFVMVLAMMLGAVLGCESSMSCGMVVGLIILLIDLGRHGVSATLATLFLLASVGLTVSVLLFGMDEGAPRSHKNTKELLKVELVDNRNKSRRRRRKRKRTDYYY